MVSENTLPLLAPSRSREREREVMVGLFVILGLLAATVIMFAATDPAMFRGRYLLTTVVPNAGGVRKGDPVQMRGVTVGKVRGFHLVPKGVAIQFEIDGDFKVPVGSKVKLVSNSILGGSTADIVPGDSTQFVGRKATIPGELEGSMFARVDDVAGSAQQVLGRVQDLLSQDTVESVNDLSQSLNKSAKGLEQVTTGPELHNIVKQLDSLSRRMDGVAATLNDSAVSAQSVLGRVEHGEGSLGRLTKDEALYSNANRAAASIGDAASELAKLAEDVRKNPKRYIDLSIF